MPKIQFSVFSLQPSVLGFTLIELLVVISILGIILTLSFAGLRGVQSSTRDADRKTDLQDIRSALEIYKSDCDEYPDSLDDLLSADCAGSTNVYMSQIPIDPQDSKGLEYEYYKSGTGYSLCASLENSSTAPAGCASQPLLVCGTSGCNYTVTNP